MPDLSHRLETLAIHAGQAPDPQTGAVVPPLCLSTTFAQREAGRPGPFEYSRSGNPTRATLEQCLAALEGGRHGVAFASGLAAAGAVFQTLLPGDHVLAGRDVYGGTYRLLQSVFGRMGVSCSWVDLTDMEQVQAAVTPTTRMCWVETPSNPLLQIVDLSAVARLCRDQGLKLIVDNTFATPALQQPLGLGADAVVHSTTKYLNGHGDVVGGAIVTSDDDFAEQLRFLQNAMGAVPSPFDCYLVLRGLKTLGLRMARQSESAAQIAEQLANHPAVARVYYPGLPSHPQHSLCRAQMGTAGAMVSCVLHGGLDAAKALTATTALFVCAESLGGVESLIEVPALMTHASIPAAVREKHGLADGLVRLSVGLEHVLDLQADLQRCLDQLPPG